ncbi:MAG: M20/M25/M40 family metallo-hydrolase [Candidatus Marinimicrobia bacterium]|jgi:carboxypeptidase Q|nr:M20/M25/M40 family metallo-hydrolase [Candidatus Neomarinimicrobiota bacterium]MBT4370256.1 M20/M25/M40 family metallo-hydrolase [Candidatus Neomarinimicrobiota bacterium]MBT4660743.1 M20/M25/M40 family metallo-hydrolase [Candidatus Neomarinimicrobiota bacterium]MBT4754002.1 M20/M25/M40 family metallo-hydrolase [Candidatus Neomarinimicrobiota bacterium]MBT5721955.1 M20/M25/M40 family metallo-hydrolase [Candidatus Neomarinimicrobiota bacterium]
MKIILIIAVMLSQSFGESIKSKYVETSLKIISKSLTDSTAYNRLGYMCDTFGPRLSGSKNLENAINWILKEMNNDGLENVKGEKVAVPTWIRGKESATLLSPFMKELSMLGLGGSIATPRGGLKAEVIVVNDWDELESRSNEVPGKIVLFNAPFTSYGETVAYRYSGASAAAKHGAVASLIRSIGPWSMNTPHTGVMAYKDDVQKIPHAALTMEDVMMLSRIHDRNGKIIVKLDMNARMVADRWSHNVLGEIKGSIYPEEVVVVGGHIDSWDVGQGAHDDGGACIASWEVLRLIKELGLKPKRTIRCVMWTNEENGGKGNKGYRDMHMDEMDKHVLAIESDGGVFSPEGFGFSGNESAREIVEEIHELMKPIGANTISEGGRAADVAPLNDEGVPVMSLKVDGSKYFWYHHTNADTFDKIDFNEFNRCIAAMAIMAYVVADLDEPLPR